MEKQDRTPGIACSKDAIATSDGRAKCKEICDERGCCWVQSAQGNCYEKYSQWCDEYKQCLILGAPTNHPQKEDEEDHPDLTEICSASGIEKDSGQGCKVKCKPRSCCFAKDMKFNCREEMASVCKEYDACKTLFDS
mmetsp:Transcript_12274/g.36028  ORF Transcript_12274/g.36028 Transcript_12274/m.36028 type:complete len:137 (+) Transcript_12274:3888-4298(+)